MDLHVYKRAVYLLHLLAFLAASSNATGTSNTRSPPTSSMQTQDAQSTLVSSFYSPAQLSSSQSTNPDTSRNWRTSDISLIGAPQSTESFVISSSKDLHLTHRLSNSGLIPGESTSSSTTSQKNTAPTSASKTKKIGMTSHQPGPSLTVLPTAQSEQATSPSGTQNYSLKRGVLSPTGIAHKTSVQVFVTEILSVGTTDFFVQSFSPTIYMKSSMTMSVSTTSLPKSTLRSGSDVRHSSITTTVENVSPSFMSTSVLQPERSSLSVSKRMQTASSVPPAPMPTKPISFLPSTSIRILNSSIGVVASFSLMSPSLTTTDASLSLQNSSLGSEMMQTSISTRSLPTSTAAMMTTIATNVSVTLANISSRTDRVAIDSSTVSKSVSVQTTFFTAPSTVPLSIASRAQPTSTAAILTTIATNVSVALASISSRTDSVAINFSTVTKSVSLRTTLFVTPSTIPLSIPTLTASVATTATNVSVALASISSRTDSVAINSSTVTKSVSLHTTLFVTPSTVPLSIPILTASVATTATNVSVAAGSTSVRTSIARIPASGIPASVIQMSPSVTPTADSSGGEPSKSSDGLSLHIWVIIGAGSATLFLLLVILTARFCFCKNMYRKRPRSLTDTTDSTWIKERDEIPSFNGVDGLSVTPKPSKKAFVGERGSTEMLGLSFKEKERQNYDDCSDSSQSSLASPEVLDYDLNDRRAGKAVGNAFASVSQVGGTLYGLASGPVPEDNVMEETSLSQLTFGNGGFQDGIVNDKN